MAEIEKKTGIPEDEEEIDLFRHRQSVRLLPENATFFRSEGGLISLTLTNPDGTKEEFERVVAVRSFPLTEPEQFVAIREPDTSNRERGEEIGMIYDMTDFDPDTQNLLRAELELRYFTPEIKKIYSVKEKLGYIYCESDTSAGKFNFVFRNPSSSVRTLEDRRVMISDIDGNCFVIRDPSKLDRSSMKKIEIYL